MRRHSRLAVTALFLALSAVQAIASDTIGEIVELLEGGLSEELILDWLDVGDGALARPSAEQLLTLKRAGASEELLRELVRRSGSTAPSPTKAPEATAGRGDAAAAPVSVAVPRPASNTHSGATAKVQIELLYVPRFDEDEEPWDLFVYLDGQPLSYVPASGELLGLAPGDPLEAELELPAGRHRVRVLQERHERRRGRWRHAARVGEPAFAFELSAGSAAKVEVAFHQGWGAETDPLTFRFTQGNRVADLEDVGGDPERWAELCEDSEKTPGRGDCVSWEALWPAGEAPGRGEVLNALAAFSFRPVPR